MKNLSFFRYSSAHKPLLSGSYDLIQYLVSGWLLNEHTGTILNNIVPGGPNFNTQNNPKWNNEEQSLNFLSASSQYATLTNGPDLTNKPFSITVRFKAISTGGNTSLFRVGNNGATDQEIHLRPTASTGFLFGLFNNDLTVTTPTDITKDYNVVTVTLNEAKLQSVYFNGILLGTRTSTSFFTGTRDYFLNSFIAGGGGVQYLDCKISCAFVHNIALTNDSVKQTHENILNITQPSPTLKYITKRPSTTYNQTVTQSISFNQSPNRVFDRTVTQTLNYSVFISNNPLYLNASSSFTFTSTNSLNTLLRKNVSQSITLTPSITLDRAITHESPVQNLIFTQIINVDRSIINETVTQTITFTQSNVKIPVRTVTQSLTFTQSNAYIIGKFVSSILTLTSTNSVVHVIHVATAHSINFQQIYKIGKVYSRTLTQSITLTPRTSKVPTQHVTQTISLIQSQTFHYVHNRTILNSLIFNPSFTYNGTHRLTLTQSINFQNIRHTNLIFNGILNEIDYYGLSVSHSSKCLVVLSTKKSNIVLPCPLFDDTQQLLHTLNIKRAMTGVKRIYIKPNSRNRINYVFRTSRQKSLEFRKFLVDNINDSVNDHNLIIDNSINLITMTNFKGEVWIGNIVLDPVLVKKAHWEQCGEEVNVAFQFEGYRVQ